MSGLASVAEKSFEVGSYLDQRAEKTDFVMVEIGHGYHPVAFQQPFEFSGNKAYIGVEGWLRDPMGTKQKHIEELRKDRGDKNIFFISQDLGVEVQRDGYAEEGGQSWLVGEYDPATHLPDEAGDEIFLNNVMSDSHIAWGNKAKLLLKEASRLATRSGLVVLREVITPENSCVRDQGTLDFAGLEIAGTSLPGDNNWDELEGIYISDRGMPIQTGSHYLFLSKT